MIAYLPYLILLLPLLAAVSIRVFLHPFPRISVAVSTFACLGSFVGSLGMLFQRLGIRGGCRACASVD